MAHVTDLGFSVDELNAAILEGQVRVQSHPTKPLYIHNYTEEVQFSKRWNKITMACRGLILDNEYNIVARPWKKFFNFGERDLEIDFNAPVEVTDKMDGSLGILYHDGDNWAIATRGSFASEQAIHATRVLHEKYLDVLFAIDDNDTYRERLMNITFLFEIIYPDNRIVVNYGLMDDLALLGAVENKLGYCMGPNTAAATLGWTGPRAETFSYATFGEAISAVDREGKEGIVIRSGSKMVKLKQADYVELHRIVTNLSPKTIWQQMGDGKTIADICSQIPDEFHVYVENIGRDLLKQASEIAFVARAEFANILMDIAPEGVDRFKPLSEQVSRRDFASRAVKSEHKNYLFLLLDSKSIDGVVWHSIKPRGDEKLVKETDDADVQGQPNDT